jgi:hypothetical protein
LHIGAGPAVSFFNTLLTGTNTLGGHVATHAARGDSQQWNNALAAFWSMNPLLESWVKPIVDEGMGKTPKREKTAFERAMKFAGPFGVKTSDRIPGAVPAGR